MGADQIQPIRQVQKYKIMKSCFLGCVLITLLSLTKPATGADWPEYLRSSQHAGWTEETLDPLHLRLAWQAPHFVAQAVIVGGSANRRTIMVVYNKRAVHGARFCRE